MKSQTKQDKKSKMQIGATDYKFLDFERALDRMLADFLIALLKGSNNSNFYNDLLSYIT